MSEIIPGDFVVEEAAQQNVGGGSSGGSGRTGGGSAGSGGSGGGGGSGNGGDAATARPSLLTDAERVQMLERSLGWRKMGGWWLPLRWALEWVMILLKVVMFVAACAIWFAAGFAVLIGVMYAHRTTGSPWAFLGRLIIVPIAWYGLRWFTASLDWITGTANPLAQAEFAMTAPAELLGRLNLDLPSGLANDALGRAAQEYAALKAQPKEKEGAKPSSWGDKVAAVALSLFVVGMLVSLVAVYGFTRSWDSRRPVLYDRPTAVDVTHDRLGTVVGTMPSAQSAVGPSDRPELYDRTRLPPTNTPGLVPEARGGFISPPADGYRY